VYCMIPYVLLGSIQPLLSAKDAADVLCAGKKVPPFLPGSLVWPIRQNPGLEVSGILSREHREGPWFDEVIWLIKNAAGWNNRYKSVAEYCSILATIIGDYDFV